MADSKDDSRSRRAVTRKHILPELRGKKITVMGLGDFGGGAGAVKFLVERGACVTVTDTRPRDELAASIAALGDCQPAEFALGGHREPDFTDADLIVVNPAIPKTNRFIALASASGVPLTSEINLFWEFNRGRTVGVTGSNGKSTTTAMTHALLKGAGRRAWLGGNIGGSLLPIVDDIQPDDWVVLELSSFQLEDLDALHVSPDVAIVTNFTPNHLDRHGTLESYRHEKQTILRWQSPAQLAILSQDDADVRNWATHGNTLWFGLHDEGRTGLFAESAGARFRDGSGEQSLQIQDWLTLPGAHNLQNALAASCCALALGVQPEFVRRGLQHYKALPHRLEFVAEIAGRKFYNDSLATTPESAQVALEAFSQPIILLAGGYDKGSDLTQMCRAIASKPVKAVAVMGSTGPAIEALIGGFDPERRINSQRCLDFSEAFRWSVGQSAPGDVILLSPGCASFDWFRNFADRGEQFRKLVTEWTGPGEGDS